MKTLVLEPDPMRAQSWVALYGGVMGEVHVARSPAQARLMLAGGSYDRLCLAAEGASLALLSVVRAVNPGCEIVDLGTRRARPANGAADPWPLTP
ncbi:hypothetical protein [Roseicyclus persicicus]|uniref:Uncharacterized protein n=1 Tax=Roseicyclus persicicus TaxID=2650661 RepID=A0A7X6GZ80_9RHOB|nr:hypothetical protein [Roseibacterium persicicum]NKX43837.1 hypothetical protein [Roseibacterium persicicum]